MKHVVCLSIVAVAALPCMAQVAGPGWSPSWVFAFESADEFQRLPGGFVNTPVGSVILGSIPSDGISLMGQGTFRLPAEAKWEYVCRVGTTTRFYWGDDAEEKQIGEYAWYLGNNNPAGVKPVGQKQPNMEDKLVPARERTAGGSARFRKAMGPPASFFNTLRRRLFAVRYDLTRPLV